MSAQIFLYRNLFFLTAVAAVIICPTEICRADPDEIPTVCEEELVELAKHDHIALLNLAVRRYEKNVKDYVGTFYKQERLKGRLGKKQTIAFKFKERPFALYMEWKKNRGKVDKLLYVKGSNDDKMIVHPTGLLSWVRSVKRDCDGKAARKASLYTCDQFGFYNSMKRVLKHYELAERNGDLKTGYIGPTEVHGRKCIAFERILPKKKDYTTARLIMKFDIEYLIPLALELYDWNDDLIMRNSFRDLTFNVGLKARDFEPATCGL